MKTLTLLLAAVAGTTASNALAQEARIIEPAPFAQTGRYTFDPLSRALVPTTAPQARATGLVYDNIRTAAAAEACGAVNIIGLSSLGEDMDFAGNNGPWAGKRNNLLTTFRWLLRNNAATQTLDVRITFWRAQDFSLANVLQNAEFVGGARLGFGAAGIGNGTWNIQFPIATLFPAVGGLVVPTDKVFAYVEYMVPGTNNLVGAGQAFGFQFTQLSSGTGPRIGSSTADMITESGFAAGLNGGPVAEDFLTGPGLIDRVTFLIGPAGIGTPAVCQNVQMDAAFDSDGELGIPFPGTATELGTVPDTGLTQTGTISNDVLWFKFNLASDATDLAAKFLDIDTVGSTANLGAALYYDNGQLAGSILGFGHTAISDVSAGPEQLSYGIGRRAAPADGVQFSGQSGQLYAGDFYLAIGPTGTIFTNGFGVFAGAGEGAYTVHLNTNTNGAALTPAVAPVVDSDLGALATTDGVGGPGTSQTLDITNREGAASWVKFTLPGDVGGCGPATQFLDIEFLAAPATTDLVSYIFDEQGTALIVSDDRGPTAADPGAFLPQYSIGAVGPRGPYDVGFNNAPFNGNVNLELAAGTYYLAFGQLPFDLAPTIDRFHTRWDGLETDRVATNVSVRFVTNASVNADECGADLDNDGDLANGADPDCAVGIEDLVFFLAAFEAGSVFADLDNDGDPAQGVPDGAVGIEDLLFFLARFEAGC